MRLSNKYEKYEQKPEREIWIIQMRLRFWNKRGQKKINLIKYNRWLSKFQK